MKVSIVNFKKGSYITVEGKQEVQNYFYIIQAGRVRVFNSLLAANINLNRVLGVGDFFGVISAMLESPSLESAVALEHCRLIRISRKEFGFLLKKSAPLALKLIRSFSDDLRKYDNELVKRTLKTQQADNLEGSFFNGGEFYFKKNNFSAASYIYVQYLKNYPEGQFVEPAQRRLSQISPSLLKNMQFESALNRKYKKGALLFSEHEPGHEAFIVNSGSVKIMKLVNDQEVLLAVLKKGDIFGEMALLNDKERTACALVDEPLSCLVLNRKNFNELMQSNVTLAVNLITILSERLWTMYKQLENLSFLTVKGRIYDTLLTQVLKQKMPLRRRLHVFDLGPEEIKEMLGEEEEKTDQALREIEEENIVQVKNAKFICEDTLTLSKEVDFIRRMDVRRRNMKAKKI